MSEQEIKMANVIIDSGNIAEIEGLENFDEDTAFSDLTATHEADASTMDFHVQMRGYTMRDFETMVVHAAAQQLLGSRNFKSEITKAATEIALGKVNDEISAALKNLMGMTATMRGKEPVTLGAMIGMEAKDYLTAPVSPRDGNPTDHWGEKVPRISYLTASFVRQHFAKELKAAMDGMVAEIKTAMDKRLTETIDAERKRIADAIGYELKARK